MAAIALGSNLGDRLANIRGGVQALAALPGVRLVGLSGLVETAAVVPPGRPAGPDFLNGAALLETDLAPRDLLAACLEIEANLGRDRRAERARDGPGAARTLDLDLLFIDAQVISETDLVLPHPRMHQRWFVLWPLSRIAPGWRHPLLGRTVAELLHDVSRAG